MPIYSWTKNVVGDKAEVENLLDGKSSPHDFQLTPKDMRKLNSANIVFAIGLELEPWLEKIQENKALKDGVTVIYLGENIDKDKLLHFTEYDTDHEKESHVIKHNDHQHGDFDPHIWLDPVLAQDCVKLICSTLENKDTEHTEIYKDNAEKYISKLKKLDKDIIEQLADIQLKPFFTQHDAFSYFNKRYSLKCVGVLEVVPDSDVTPKHLRDLLRQIREQDVVAIMVPSRGNTRMVKQLASDGRIKIGTLETLGVLDEGELNADTYERLMRKNIHEILSTLK